MYEAAFEYVAKTGELYYNYYQEVGEAYHSGKPRPSRPEVPRRCLKKIEELSPGQKASLISIAIIVARGGITDTDKSVVAAAAEQDAELEFSEDVDRALQDALVNLLHKLSKASLRFHSEYHLQKYLRELETNYVNGRAPTLTREALLDFLRNNYHAYRSSRVLNCCLKGIVDDISNRKYCPPDDEKVGQALAEFQNFLGNMVEDKNNWFLDFLPQLDGWSLHLGSKIRSLPEERRSNWRELFEYAEKAHSKKVTKTFLKGAGSVLDNIPDGVFSELMDEVEDSLGQRGIVDLPHKSGLYSSDQLLHLSNVPRVRGLLGMSRLSQAPKMAITLERIIDRCFRKIPGVGPLEEMLGQTALDSLVELNSSHTSEVLKRLHDTYKKNKNISKRLIKAIELDRG